MLKYCRNRISGKPGRVRAWRAWLRPADAVEELPKVMALKNILLLKPLSTPAFRAAEPYFTMVNWGKRVALIKEWPLS